MLAQTPVYLQMQEGTTIYSTLLEEKCNLTESLAQMTYDDLKEKICSMSKAKNINISTNYLEDMIMDNCELMPIIFKGKEKISDKIIQRMKESKNFKFSLFIPSKEDKEEFKSHCDKLEFCQEN